MLQAKRRSVIPLENGIQVKGMGMDPGFHRGDDKAWVPALRPCSGHAFTGKTEGAVDFSRLLAEGSSFGGLENPRSLVDGDEILHFVQDESTSDLD